MWDKNICLTNRKTILVVIVILFSTLVLAGVLYEPENIIEIKPKEAKEEIWIPTQEDINYQDSMYQIIQQTQLEVDTIKDQMEVIIYKLDRLEYADGTWDSIRIKQ